MKINQNYQIHSHSVSYGLFERVFRAAYFQYAVKSAGWLEQVIIYIYRCFEKMAWCSFF